MADQLRSLLLYCTSDAAAQFQATKLNEISATFPIVRTMLSLLSNHMSNLPFLG
jgi:hypothetical protein